MSNTNVIPAVRIAAMTLAIVCANQGYAAAAEAEAGSAGRSSVRSTAPAGFALAR
jgi:hypothetical protein